MRLRQVQVGRLLGPSLALPGLAGVGLIAVRAYRVGPSRTTRIWSPPPSRRAARPRGRRIGLAVSGAALAVLGGVLVAAGKKRPAPTRARVVPYGAGLGLHGSF